MQEVSGQGKALAGHLGGTAATGAHHIGPARRDLACAKVNRGRNGAQQCRNQPEQAGPHKEVPPAGEGRLAGCNEADVAAEVAYVLAVGIHHQLPACRCLSAFCALAHLERHRFAAQGDEFASGCIVITVLDGADDKVSVAARDERILEGLGVAVNTGLDVVNLEVRREIHLGRLKERYVALSADGYAERTCVVRLQRVAAQGGVHPEGTHATAERRRSAGGNAGHVDFYGGGAHALAHGAIFILEEAVEDAAAGSAPVPYVHKANEFGRVDGDLSGLLGDERPAAENCCVVDAVSHVLPVEFYVLRGLHLLAPEACESREAGVFESGDVDSVIELERCADGLSHHRFGLADGKAHEDVFSAGGVCAAGVAGRALTLLLPPLLGACAAGYHLDGNAARRYFLTLDRCRCRRQLEGAGCARHKYISISGLRRLCLLAVNYADRG